ncbi:TonB-dependent receptor [Thiohalorhabdus sp. Cl-TMA]|uniref:TonB-dependent receptor n=1 Tax=Thiohalorhabdus methylotrophus TaxID=3242694 RepID=A0ABV4TUX3_9GAMM
MLCSPPLLAQNAGEGDVPELPQVEVIGITPQHGTGLPVSKVPANVQTVSEDEIEQAQALDVTHLMERRVGSVNLNLLGGNPLQPDVNFRGFRGSPLLGLPQGVSVYQDGVRINESFGDVVNWDLVPETAIASMEVMSGSNPLFGLNTLGGAISMQTKSGFTHTEERVKAYGGSFGRYEVTAEAGGNTGETGFYIAGNRFEEDGWRDHSDSEANTVFGKASWRGEDSTADIIFNMADTELRGNGAVPVELMNQDRDAVFTHPDLTENRMEMITFKGSHFFTDNIALDGDLFVRRTDTETFNGDDSDYEECEDPGDAGSLCSDDGEGDVVLNQEGNEVAESEDVESATLNTSDTRQRTYGGSLQSTFTQSLWDMENQFVVGASASLANIRFHSQTELGRLTDNRGTEGSNEIVLDSLTTVEADREDLGVYLTDTLSVTDSLSLTLSGRYNNSHIKLDDQLGTALNGDHTYTRFNPAGGLTYEFSPLLSTFVSYSESNRAPTPVELTCADPDDPCRLPNGFQADPPLDQVVAKTWEAGFRGSAKAFQWSLGAFRTQAEDDIYFISAGPARNSGYFDNIGTTQRQGLEAAASGRAGPVSWFLNYTYLEATFQEDFAVNSPDHPDAVNDEIQVEEGDRIPLNPEHIVKAGADWRITPTLAVGVDGIYNGEQYIRGDESNQLEPIDAFTVVNLRARYQVLEDLQLFARVDNVFDTEYETAGLLGEPDEVEGFDNFENPRFYTPGAPRGAWAGVEYTF